jgi:DeoR family transcriptional regulator, glycerol-3-phosphate regulon repressor
MVAEGRRQAILALAQQGGELRVDELAQQFNVSRETMRRDLDLLQSQGLLRRVHGGALPAQTGAEAGFKHRLVANSEAKQKMAKLAAGLFRRDDTLFIDTGTTTLMLGAALASVNRLTVITNSVGVARLMSGPGVDHRVYIVGGEYRPDTEQILGSASVAQIEQFRADHAVFSCGALDRDGTLMDFDLEEAMFAKAIIEQARTATLIIDSSKFDRIAIAKICDLAPIDRVVTDRLPPPHFVELFRANEVELLVADNAGDR